MRPPKQASERRKLTVEIGSSIVRYQVQGTGPPLVLVHGLAGSTDWWTRNVDAFSRYCTVYLIDLPGFGSMRNLRHQFSVAGAANWLASFITVLDLPQVSFVGHSMGGLITAMFAAEWPEKVSRLILVAPAIALSKASIGANLLPLALNTCYVHPRFFPQLVWDSARAGWNTLIRSARELLKMDIQGELEKIQAPCLLIWGQQDRLVPPELADNLNRTIRDSRLCIIPRAGHIVMFDRPDTFNDLVLRFLFETEGHREL